MQNRSNVTRRIFAGIVLSLVACTSVACGGDDDVKDGQVHVTAYGEEFIEQGISADDTEDGWAISFDRFTVKFEDIEVGDESFDGPKSVELARDSGGEGFAITTLDDVDGGKHDDAEFTISELTVTGSATRDDVTKTFDWKFSDKVKYTDCDATVTVDGEKAGKIELTIHADHLFSDSLVSTTPSLRFAPLAAADADDDGVISQAELEDAGVGAYDVGNANIDNLWDFVRAQSNHLGHVNGEGHCKSEVL